MSLAKSTLKLLLLSFTSFLSFFYHSNCTAQTALLADIGNASAGQLNADLEGQQIGDSTFFALADNQNGQELWKRSSSGQFSLLKDINPGPNSSAPSDMIVFNNKLIFVATHPTFGTELWVSDGTTEGTDLLKDIVAGSGSLDGPSLSRTYIAQTSDQNFLYILDETKLIRTDGTTNGTTVLVNGTFFDKSGLVLLNGNLFMAGQLSGSGVELLKYDGAALSVLKDINPGAPSSNPLQMTLSNGKIFFYANDGINGTEPWVSDGTAGGTNILLDILSGSSGLTNSDLTNAKFINLNPTFTIFPAKDAVNGNELWKSDGSTIGTALIQDFTPGVASSAMFSFFKLDSRVVYSCSNSSSGQELCSYDGNTITLYNLNPGTPNSTPIGMGVCNGKYYFYVGVFAPTPGFAHEPWIFDGVNAPSNLKDIISISTASVNAPSSTVCSSNKTYFLALDPVFGRELYSSDGTTPGTQFEIDLVTSTVSSLPFNLKAFDNKLFFGALPPTINSDSGSSTNFAKLWTTDGTAGQTIINSDVSSVSGNIPTLPIISGGKLYMSGSLPVVPNFGPPTTTGNELIYFNSGSSTPNLVADIFTGISSSNPRNFGIISDKILFSATYASGLIGLYSFDGNNLIQMITGITISNPFFSRTDAGATVFSGSESTNGAELWGTDGTIAGTTIIKDINPGSASSSPEWFAELDDATILFSATSSASGTELWKTDGSAVGTVIVKDINPGTSSSSPKYTTSMGDFAIFSANCELWRTDGTPGGTLEVMDINPGTNNCSQPLDLVRSGNKVFFTATDGTHGRELWVSDGTLSGTNMVLDIVAGSGSTTFENLRVSNGLAYFSADDGVSGAELWRSNGTQSGTFRILDIFDGPRSSSPKDFTSFGSLTYFTADDGTHGREVWSTDGVKVDFCPSDDNKIFPGICGCGFVEDLSDTDSDTVVNCLDLCPNDSNKSAPGVCGCGVLDTDLNSNNVIDCNETDEEPQAFIPTKAQLKYLRKLKKLNIRFGAVPSGARIVALVKLNGKKLRTIRTRKQIIKINVLKKGRYTVTYKVTTQEISEDDAISSERSILRIKRI